MWFDAKVALTEIRSVKSLKVSRIDAEPKLDRISTNSTISTAGRSIMKIHTSKKIMVNGATMRSEPHLMIIIF